jgi:hypothetical protein
LACDIVIEPSAMSITQGALSGANGSRSVVLSFPRVQGSFLHTPIYSIYSDIEGLHVFNACELVSMIDWLNVQGTGGGAMNHEPTVTQIVDCIMALDCGESCDVRLDPHITRISNLEWLLPICFRQFGTEIAIREHPQGERVVLTITVTATRRHKTCQPTSQDEPIAAPKHELVGVADDHVVAVA